MAWRPTEYLIEGVLDNTQNNKVTGWMKFAGLNGNVTFDLAGNFHRDIRGAKIRLRGEGEIANLQQATAYMQDFSTLQKGKVGDMTAGREPCDYGALGQAYAEWYSDDNGRVVLELETDQVELLTQPIPAMESDPIDRKQQAENMAEFLGGMAEAIGIPQDNAIAVGNTVAVQRAKKVIANDKLRGMKLLPQEIREILPALGAQDGKGGRAIAYLKLFTPDSGFTWWITEGGPITDDGGNVVDYHLFGLVQGQCKELGYVSLSELEEVRGPMGLPIERDLHWRSKMLAEIAPEMFERGDGS